MSVFIAVVVLLVVYSHSRAKHQGIVWFGWSRKQAQPKIRYHRPREGSIKPVSPWVKRNKASHPSKAKKAKTKKGKKTSTPQASPTIKYDRPREGNIKPVSPQVQKISAPQASPTIKYNRPREGSIKPVSPWLQKKPSAVPVPTRKKSKPPNRGAERAALRRLDTLTHNSETSERLVKSVALKYPERGPQWCIDKAIHDIERDRMAR